MPLDLTNEQSTLVQVITWANVDPDLLWPCGITRPQWVNSSGTGIRISEMGHHWLRWWLGAKQVPSHYVYQCWHIINLTLRNIFQGWGQFRNWNWNWYQFQFQELELQRNWIKGIGIGIGIDKEELKELIQFLFLIVNSFWFFAMFLAESLNQFDLQPFWIQLTRISLDRYIILYDDLSIKWILHGSYWLHL